MNTPLYWKYMYPDRLCPIKEALAWQEELFQQKLAGDSSNYLLFAEHPPCVTYARDEQLRHLKVSTERLRELGISLREVAGRGGSITYHGPGQIVIYAVVDIGAIGLISRVGSNQDMRDDTTLIPDAFKLLSVFDGAIIQTLGTYGLVGGTKPTDPTFENNEDVRGVWIEGKRKIASHGLRARIIHNNPNDPKDYRLISRGGAAFNINTDLAGFSHINPCGYPIKMTSCERELGEKLDMAEITVQLIENFERILQIPLHYDRSSMSATVRQSDEPAWT
jgi:lipoyl(octanoyl) transferase